MDSLAKRVARRHLAEVQLDEPMKALLLKLRKGADASLSMGKLITILTKVLSGWSVEKFTGLVQRHGHDKNSDAPQLLAETDEHGARRAYDLLKRNEVTAPPTHPAIGKQYVMGLEDFHSWQSGTQTYYGARYKEWVGAAGLKFASPDGKTFELLPSKYSNDWSAKSLRPGDALRWLKSETPYLTQINALLGMDAHEPAVPRSRDNTGTCGVCFRNIKLAQNGSKPTMALHGYNRPGHGTVVGRCWGGSHSPYELSPEATKIIMLASEDVVAKRNFYLRGLRDPNLQEFDEQKWWSGSSKPRLIQKSEVSPILWDHGLKTHIKDTEYAIKKAEHEAKIYQWLVHNWEVRELPHEGDKLVDWFETALQHVRKSAT